MNAKKIFQSPLTWVGLGIVLLLIGFSIFSQPSFRAVQTDEGLSVLQNESVETVTITEGQNRVDVTLAEPSEEFGRQVQFYYIDQRAAEVIAAVDDAQPSEGFDDVVPQPSWFLSLLPLLVPLLIIGFLAYFFISSQSLGGGRSKVKQVTAETPKNTFADVAGADEAVEEMQEIKEFLAEPEKFQALGARIPKGVLLYGPPGTGKTLLARAVAGEAEVPFYLISGSDFVEKYVGVGAKRVRDLFEQAKKNAPAIIFIDEIDAVGRHRGAGVGGGNDEREQTLNQLLVEMDGFDKKTSVILIAATNRPDVLDPALLRPGRFDRQIGVDAPDLVGREKILRVHSEGKPLDPSVDLASLARKTPGFTGADLENLMNEAAILTARSNAQMIDNRALDEATDRVIAGPQRRSRVMRDQERLITAYHEGGHALVAAALNHSDPVTKITILPRGRALGYTMVMPVEDRYSVTRNQLLDQLAYAMGGRVAEEIIFHDPTTGAGNDIQKATDTARKMVTEYGMSAAIGSVKLGGDDTEPFMGRGGGGTSRDYSETVAELIDTEVRELIDQAHFEAYEALSINRDVLDELAKQLLEKETLDQAQISAIFANVRKLPDRMVWLSNVDRPVSDRPPIELPNAPLEGSLSTASSGQVQNMADAPRGASITNTEAAE